MPNDYLDISKITETRRKALEKSIKAISVEELHALGQELFPHVENPWRERYFKFIEENAGGAFYHATTNDRIEIIYSPAKDEGMWFLPGNAMGPLQETGRKIMKEIIGKI